MGRRRAGHGWSSRQRGARRVHVLANDAGQWITTGEAQGWRRCPRCRAPFENDPFESGLCVTCYFYHNNLPVSTFWRLHEQGYLLAPYNIGDRVSGRGRIIVGNFQEQLRAQEKRLRRLEL